MMDFETAIKKPFSNVTKLIIGCALNILPIVNFLAYGYILQTANYTANNNNKLPEWEKWGDLFVKGLLGAVISIIYGIPLIVIALIGFAATIGLGDGFTQMLTGNLSGLASLGAIFVILAILGVLLAYILPAVLAIYALTWNFSDAFKFGDIFKKAFTATYFVPWIVGAVICLILTFVLGFIPIVGTAIGSFIGYLMLFTLVAETFKKGTVVNKVRGREGKK